MATTVTIFRLCVDGDMENYYYYYTNWFWRCHNVTV